MTSYAGFIFYSLSCYLFVLFMGWLLNPTVDKIIEDDQKNQHLRSRGQRMRAQNLAEAAEYKDRWAGCADFMIRLIN